MAAPRVHFLDVGEREYGDAMLLELGEKAILVDGAHPGDQVGSPGHPSIPQQIGELLGVDAPPYPIDLLIVSHAHQDHIGCLPHLVGRGLLDVEWALVADPGLGWGRALDEDSPPLADAPTSNLLAAWREELRDPRSDDAELRTFIADAVTLEQTYTTMLEALGRPDARVIRWGRDDPTDLLEAFADVGLEILGPSQAQLVACAELISRATEDAASVISDRFAADADGSEVDLYRQLTSPASDAVDAVSRPGPAINLQSIVARFSLGDVSLLLAGDMQFAAAQVSSDIVTSELAKLRSAIAKRAPYSLVKLSHHGSDNAFDADVLAELGETALYGICAGEESTHHPHATVLQLLQSQRERLRWVRTDRNGLVSIEFDPEPRLMLSRGAVSDPEPNAVDAPALEGSTEQGKSPSQPRLSYEAASTDEVEVVTRVPAGVSQVQVTIAVDRQQASTSAHRPSVVAGQDASFALAGGRSLPALLFVTDSSALAKNIGTAETSAVLAAVESAGQTLLDLGAGASADVNAALAKNKQELQARDEIEGVVLVGGYDAIPAQRIDTLPASLRAQMATDGDADNFIVWSDHGYGDSDGDGIAELPVSRIPDAHSSAVVIGALGASGLKSPSSRAGIRNVARPFAEQIYQPLPGAATLGVSHPMLSSTVPPDDAELVYLMLHGHFSEGMAFRGEQGGEFPVAFTVENAATHSSAQAVLAGCCWGALTVDQPASYVRASRDSAVKAPAASIAVTYLAQGATAFVGCTGTHYSPTEEPYGYFGGPMQESFWRHILAGTAPAPALHAAKIDYVAGFPHGRSSQYQQAIEYKILRQFTCLGLGW